MGMSMGMSGTTDQGYARRHGARVRHGTPWNPGVMGMSGTTDRMSGTTDWHPACPAPPTTDAAWHPACPAPPTGMAPRMSGTTDPRHHRPGTTDGTTDHTTDQRARAAVHRPRLRPPVSAPDPAALPGWVPAIPAVTLATVSLLIGLDIGGAPWPGAPRAHLALELAILLAALTGTLAPPGQLLAARRRARALQRDLSRAQADLARFRAESQEHLAGSAAIGRQLGRWAHLRRGGGRAPPAQGAPGPAGDERADRPAAGARRPSQGRAHGAGGAGRLFLEDLLLPRGPRAHAQREATAAGASPG